MSSTDSNPYESPRDPSLPSNHFADDRAEVADLRRRVVELERRLGRNWLVSPHWLRRIMGVWGYFLLGYLIIWAVVFAVVISVMAVIWLVTGVWPS